MTLAPAQGDCNVNPNPLMVSLSNHERIGQASRDRLRMNRSRWKGLLSNRPIPPHPPLRPPAHTRHSGGGRNPVPLPRHPDRSERPTIRGLARHQPSDCHTPVRQHQPTPSGTVTQSSFRRRPEPSPPPVSPRLSRKAAPPAHTRHSGGGRNPVPLPCHPDCRE